MNEAVSDVQVDQEYQGDQEDRRIQRVPVMR